jgi:DNA primase
MIWRRGDHVMPYGLSRLDKARAAGAIILVEGESDSLVCWFTGVPAMAAGSLNLKKYKRLQNIATVYVWREQDKGGDSLATVRATFDVRLLNRPPAS